MLLLYTALIDEESDKLLFEGLYLKYRAPMTMIARGILHDSMEAEDAVQCFYGNCQANQAGPYI